MTRDWSDSDYVRIYHSVKTDEKLGAVYHDDRLFSWYVRLLLEAHLCYPTPAFIPRSLPERVLRGLVERGVILVTGDFYTVSGLVKERVEVTGRAGGIVRAATAERDGGRFAPTPPMGVVSDEIPDGREDIEVFVERFRRPPTPAQREVLDRSLRDHDVTGAKWAADIMRASPDDMIGAVIAASKAWRDQRGAEARAVEKAKPRRGIRDPLIQEIAATMAARETEGAA